MNITHPAVRVEGVHKWFGATTALQGASLSVARSDFMVLLGRNGAGKSTLLRVIARVVRPNSGTIEINGIDLRRHPERVRSDLGFVAHSTYLYRKLTARENLRFFARIYQLDSIESRVSRALEWAGLEEHAHRQVDGFSRGMQQRLAIARATLHDPQILLLDEPFSGLDLEASELLAGWMREFVAGGKTILMATHDLQQGLESVTRWVFLEKGRIVRELSGDYHTVRSEYRDFLKERRGELF
ncbi:MAG: heme ABC exporter ATP-binding protein CcmA [Acidobacteriota bacterium]